MTSRLRVEARCKINLLLRVLAREDTGFHRIETIFQALEWGDTLDFEMMQGGGIELDVEGADLGDPRDNLVYRAAESFFEQAALGAGVRIELTKRIPAGGGLGGGSSDAAATLRGLNHMFDRPLDERALMDVAATLGSDVPFFLVPSGRALGWGRGTRLLELEPLPPRPVVVVSTGVHVATPDAYAALSGRGLKPSRAVLLRHEALDDWAEVAELSENDFEDPVFEKHPELRSVLDRVSDQDALIARMSGSGSAVFGVFDSEETARRAVGALEEAFPDAEVVRTRTATGLGEVTAVEG
jgi:4-diphosphocytidyl-2-C-methyl-D-erythritol kinase